MEKASKIIYIMPTAKVHKFAKLVFCAQTQNQSKYTVEQTNNLLYNDICQLYTTLPLSQFTLAIK